MNTYRTREILNGTGIISKDGEEVPVQYEIQVRQEMIDAGDNQEIPGNYDATGFVSPQLFPVGTETRLRLADGRTARIVWLPNGTARCHGID